MTSLPDEKPLPFSSSPEDDEDGFRELIRHLRRSTRHTFVAQTRFASLASAEMETRRERKNYEIAAFAGGSGMPPSENGSGTRKKTGRNSASSSSVEIQTKERLANVDPLPVVVCKATGSSRDRIRRPLEAYRKRDEDWSILEDEVWSPPPSSLSLAAMSVPDHLWREPREKQPTKRSLSLPENLGEEDVPGKLVLMAEQHRPTCTYIQSNSSAVCSKKRIAVGLACGLLYFVAMTSLAMILVFSKDSSDPPEDADINVTTPPPLVSEEPRRKRGNNVVS